MRVHLKCPIALGVQTAGRKLSSTHRPVVFLKHKLCPKGCLMSWNCCSDTLFENTVKRKSIDKLKTMTDDESHLQVRAVPILFIDFTFVSSSFFTCLQVCIYASISVLPSQWLTLVNWGIKPGLLLKDQILQ